MRALMKSLLITFRDMLPILMTIGVFQIVVLGERPEDLGMLIVGVIGALVGLTLLIQGLEMSLFPLGEALADVMARRGHPAWLLGFAFALGFGSTAAEPALAAVASEAASAMVREPGFPATEAQLAALATQIRYGVAVSLGLAMMLGVWRILKGWPVIWLVLPGYGIIALVTLVSDAPFVAVALDAGTASTSVMNIPLMMALGIGFASVLRRRDALLDGFGMVVLASLTPMLTFLAAAFLMVSWG